MSSPFRLRLNKTSLENLPLPARTTRATYYDTEVLGLQLRLTDRGVKSFYVFRSKRGRPERITIGRFPTLSVAQARAKDRKLVERPQLEANAKLKVFTAGKDVKLDVLPAFQKKTQRAPRHEIDVDEVRFNELMRESK